MLLWLINHLWGKDFVTFEPTVFLCLQEKSSGASELGLRERPRPRTIFQAGLTTNAHTKPRRQSRKLEHSVLLVSIHTHAQG